MKVKFDAKVSKTAFYPERMKDGALKKPGYSWQLTLFEPFVNQHGAVGSDLIAVDYSMWSETVPPAEGECEVVIKIGVRGKDLSPEVIWHKVKVKKEKV